MNLNDEDRHILDELIKIGIPISEIRGREPEKDQVDFYKLRARIYNAPLCVMETEDPTALGAMILAGTYLRNFRDIEEGVQKTVKRRQVIQPETNRISTFEDRYRIYKEIYLSCRHLYGQMK